MLLHAGDSTDLISFQYDNSLSLAALCGAMQGRRSRFSLFLK